MASYRHILVSDLKTTNEGVQAVNRATMAHPQFGTMDYPIRDGVVVSQNLAVLCDTVTAFNKLARFGVANDCKFILAPDNTGAGNLRVTREVWVYMEGDTYAMARIGYRDYSNNNSGSKYGICARGIKNKKYREWNESHYVLTSEKIEVAKKLVRTHIRPYTMYEVASQSLDAARSNTDRAFDSSDEKLDVAKRNVRVHSDLYAELNALIYSGYKFVSEGLREAVLQMQLATEENNIYKTKAVHMYFVRVGTDRMTGEQTLDIMTVFDIRKVQTVNMDKHQMTSYRASSLPQELADDIVGKVAVLSMLQSNGAHVEDVGTKIADNIYWVVKG